MKNVKNGVIMVVALVTTLMVFDSCKKKSIEKEEKKVEDVDTRSSDGALNWEDLPESAPVNEMIENNIAPDREPWTKEEFDEIIKGFGLNKNGSDTPSLSYTKDCNTFTFKSCVGWGGDYYDWFLVRDGVRLRHIERTGFGGNCLEVDFLGLPNGEYTFEVEVSFYHHGLEQYITNPPGSTPSVTIMLDFNSWTIAGSGTEGWHIGDFDGDNKDDIFRYVPGTSGAEVFLSDGSSFVYDGSWTPASNGAAGWYIGNFDGIGGDDIFRYVPGTSGAEVFLSNGSSFVHAGSWTDAGYGTTGWHIGDFNGDKKDDIFRYVPGTSGADVFLSTGSSFEYSGSWTTAGHGTQGWYIGDFDGKNGDDIFRYVPGTSGADVFLSNGSNGFVHAGSWTIAGSGSVGWHIGDFNGDKKDDIFRYIPGTSGADVFLSNGSSFEYSGSWTGASHGEHGWYLGKFSSGNTTDIFRYIQCETGADMFLSNGFTGFTH